MVHDILRKIQITRRHWNYLLNGQRNASPKLARRIESATGIEKSVFVFGSELKRKSEWKKFTKRASR